MTEPIQHATKSLLEQEQDLAERKGAKIKALLDERVELAKNTEARLVAIADELKALGWHRSKTARTLTITNSGAAAQK